MDWNLASKDQRLPASWSRVQTAANGKLVDLRHGLLGR